MQTTYLLFAQIVSVFPLKNETVRISIIEKTLKPGTTNINLNHIVSSLSHRLSNISLYQIP